MTNDDLFFDQPSQEDTYQVIRDCVLSAQKSIYKAVNTSMVNAYWEIGRQIYIACGKQDRAAYGHQLLEYLSLKLCAEFGKGFDASNLRNMRRFYLAFPIQDALRPE